jgi:CelD/BcsL family acetyltransferase involved in cellulose biosynthesis
MATLDIEIIDDDTRIAALERDWSALLASTPQSAAFQSFAWVSSCRAAAVSDGRLFSLVFRDGRRTVAILPTEIGPHGDLRFVGHGPLSNYLGPVYDPARTEDVVDALGALLARERRVEALDLSALRRESPFLAAVRRIVVPGWSTAHIVETATCPYVDLTPGWAALCARHTAKSRATVARKFRRLERLGKLDFEEIVDPGRVEAAMPAMAHLFGRRWAGRHDSGGFAGRHREFQARAAVALAAAGHVRLSVLRLDGEIIAFAYGLRTGSVTASYVMSHDDTLGACSPGLLLLHRLLEAACRRGDPEYDFSVGEETYKDAWATGSRGVFRVVAWRRSLPATVRGRVRVLGTRAWVRARSIDWLRDLRREGIRRRRNDAPRDAPGLTAGTGDAWHVQRLSRRLARSTVTACAWRYGELVRQLSPRLLTLAVERALRGDESVALLDGERLLGVAWRAGREQAATVAGGVTLDRDDVVFYHPVPPPGATLDELMNALADVAAPGAAVVVTRERVCESVAMHLGRFLADDGFRRSTGQGTAPDRRTSAS